MEGKTTVVYATTEPLEALQLGGHCALLHERRLQQGRTPDVFRAPASIAAARSFSDPPINLIPASVDAGGMAQLGAALPGAVALPLTPPPRQAAAGHAGVVLGLRAHSLHLAPPSAREHAMPLVADLAEIGGSETSVHGHSGAVPLVAQSGRIAAHPRRRCVDHGRLLVDPQNERRPAPLWYVGGRPAIPRVRAA